MRRGRVLLALPVFAAIAVFCLAPLAALGVISLFTVSDLDLVPGVSLSNWATLFSDRTFGVLIGKSVLAGLGTALATAVIGYPFAIAMARLDRAWKAIALTVLLTPLYTGELVRLYAWRLTLGAEGLLNSFLRWAGLIDRPLQMLLFSPFATALVQVYDTLPFMVLAIWISAEMIDPRMHEAARDLGARPLQAFRLVTFPLTVPGLAAGAFAAFALAAGDLLTPSLLGGTSGATTMAMIDSLFGTAFDWPLASVLSLALLAVLVAAAALVASLLLRLRGARAAMLGGVR